MAAALGSVLSSCRIKRIRDKYEVELQELERSERKLQERCNELKGRLVELEGESIRLQGLLKHKEQEVEETRKVSRGQGWGGGWLQHTARQHAVSRRCHPAGTGPAVAGAEQPGRSDPAGVCRQAGGHGGGEQEAEGRDGRAAHPAAPGAGQGGTGEGPRAGGGAQEVRCSALGLELGQRAHGWPSCWPGVLCSLLRACIKLLHGHGGGK